MSSRVRAARAAQAQAEVQAEEEQLEVQKEEATDANQIKIYKPKFYKTAALFSQLTDSKIKLRIVKENITPCTDGKTIVLTTSNEGTAKTPRDVYTIAEHEFWHILFKSDRSIFKQLASDFSGNTELTVAAANFAFILEDHRIESLGSMVYTGTGAQLSQLKKHLKNGVAKTPTDVALAVRATRYDLIPAEFKTLASELNSKVFSIVERSGPASTYVAVKRAIEITKDWYKKQIIQAMQQQQAQEKQQDAKQSQGHGSQGDDNDEDEQEGQEQRAQQEGQQDESSEESSEDDSTESSPTDNSEDSTEDSEEESTTESEEDSIPQPSIPVESPDGQPESEPQTIENESDKEQGNEQSGEQQTEADDKETESAADDCSTDSGDNKSGQGQEAESTVPEAQIPELSMDQLKEAEQMAEAEMGNDLQQTIEELKENNFEENRADIETEQADLSGDEKELLEKAKKEADELLDEIEHKMRGTEPEINLKKGIVGEIETRDVFNNSLVKATPNKEAVHALRTAFGRIKGKAALHDEEDGLVLNIDNLIQRKATKDCNVRAFLDESNDMGLNISLLLDCSGSMTDGSFPSKMDLAKKALLTLLDAVENLKNVHVEIYGFGGGLANITPVVKLSKQRVASVTDRCEWSATHTWRAVQYVANTMRNKNGKKLMIILTDGEPCAAGYDETQVTVFTSQAVTQARKQGIKVFTIMVQPSSDISEKRMKVMFGTDDTWKVIPDMSRASEVLVNYVAQAILKLMYRRI